MPRNVNPDRLAEKICRQQELPVYPNRAELTELLRGALAAAHAGSIAAAKAACLEIAEEEAERCRAVGATAAQQTALTIAERIRRRHVES